MAHATSDHEYFRNNDDFYHVPRCKTPLTVSVPNRMQALLYTASVAVCAGGLLFAVIRNADLLRREWVRHPTPVEYTTFPDSEPVVIPSYPQQPLPDSGSIHIYTKKERIAPFEIDATKSGHNPVKLVDADTKEPVLAVFVQEGSRVDLNVPLGTYKVRYASGEPWYGYEYLFGPNTAYAKADETFSFDMIEDRVRGFTITLYKVENGNLHTSAIAPKEF